MFVLNASPIRSGFVTEEQVQTLGNPGDVLSCSCGKTVTLLWGTMPPEHLSMWINPEKCSHKICQYVSNGSAKENKFKALEETYIYCSNGKRIKKSRQMCGL